MEHSKIIIATLSESEEPLLPGDLVKITGLDKKDVVIAIANLKKEDKIYSPKRCYYDVKK